MSRNSILKYIGIIGVFLLLLTITDSWNTFHLPPDSVHQWRQADCLAYVKTYYRDNSGFFNPGTFNLAGKEGKVVSEFPILYYLAANIERIVGEHFWVIRGLTFFCYVIGLIFLLKIIRLWIPHYFLASVPVLLLATSPFYYYYALNFLPNIPAISISFIGLYFLLRYERERKFGILVLGILSFALSTLLKPTGGGIILVAYCCVRLYHYFNVKEEK